MTGPGDILTKVPGGAHRRARVLVASASVGAGHNAVAEALCQGLAGFAPEVEVKCVDVLDYTSRLFRAKYAAGYSLAVTKFPRVYGLCYAWKNRWAGPSLTGSERRRLAADTRSLRNFTAFVRQFQPDLVVHTHLLAGPVLAALGEAGGIFSPQWVAVTDILPHRWWYSPGIGRWFVPQQPTQTVLQNWGVPASRITLSGMAIQAKWHEPLPPRAQLLAELRLPTDKKIVLLSGGAMFTCGPIVEIARSLARARGDVCVVALAGRSKKLLGKLARLAESRAGKIVPVGFTDNLHKYAAIASLVITKAGGATTAECLARPAAMVLLKPVPGQEQDNAEFFANRGAAAIVRNDNYQARHGVVDIVQKLLADPAKLKKIRHAAANLYRPGRETITQAIAEHLREKP